jgi:hypothetical protein
VAQAEADAEGPTMPQLNEEETAALAKNTNRIV